MTDEKSPYRAFQPQPVEPKFPRDRGFQVTHTRLEVRIDERAGTVVGRAALSVRAIVPTRRLELDASDMRIQKVRSGGRDVRFEHVEPRLSIDLGRQVKEGAEAKVEIRYEAHPQKGLYFIRPDRHYPKKPVQVWSQGESEDNHHWFPGYDYPNNKATSEAFFTVRDPLVAFSNGHLVGRVKSGPGWTTYHWKQDVAQPNYLIAVVVGAFDEVREDWEGIPLHYFVPKGQKAWAKETFKHTRDILSFFSKATGYQYPYPKYAQAVIADFMWGGMENTSMTTVNERFLILPEHRDDADPDGLVAHEAAHQWFGDLVTTKSWDHIWLNEGFATYFDALFHESFYGKDLFQLEMLDNAEAYFAEDRDHYRRPIVTREFAENEDLFDRHTYQKGSLVLHMLRHELGDALWWKSIRHYVKKFEWRNVETADFKIAIEEATGRNLDWFFEQWIFRAGHPALEVTWDYDDTHHLVKVNVKQTQKVVGDTPLFRFPLSVWSWSGPKDRREHVVQVTKAQETFFLPAAKRPVCVQLDPDGILLKRLSFEKGAKEWAFQLQHAPSAIARIEACRALGKKASDPLATEALSKALRSDGFWGVRRAAAGALGDQMTGAARDALASHLSDSHPKVRRGVARALGNFRADPAAVKSLHRLLSSEKRSDYVVAAALYGLAQTRAASAFPTLARHLSRGSHNEIVRTSALAALVELRDAKAIPILVERTKYGVQPYVRAASTNALGRLWDFMDPKGRREIEDVLVHLMRDASHAQRRSAYAAAALVPAGSVASALAAQVESEPIGLLKKVARDAMRDLHERMGELAQLGELKKQFEELQAENRKLGARLAEVEGRLKAKAGKGKGK